MDASAALLIFFNETTTAADRDRLVALLADCRLRAIQEDDIVRPAKWVAHFEDPAGRDDAADAIRRSPEFRELRTERVEVEDEDWARRTQADLPAIRVGRVIVAPPWDVPWTGSGMRDARSEMRGAESGIPSPMQSASRSPDPGLVVVIEPSRGFGTGHHQSTRLCLALLQNRDLQGRTVIDVGTGSGVLAIAAARLGAAYVAAIDVDPDAVENARENVARNGVAAIVEAHVTDLGETTLPPADVVTANLTASLLERHAEVLARLVKRGGVLIAAGFTVDDFDRVAAAFAPTLSVVESAEEDDWWGVALN